MRVAVIGAGVIGVTTAYELGVDGHDVTVFERRGTVAAESSFANAGLVAPGYVSPVGSAGHAGQGLLAPVARPRAGAHRPASRPVDAAAGSGDWWRACEAETYRANRSRMHRLAHFSRERLHGLTQRLHLDFERGQGFLVLLRSAQDLALAEPGIRALTELGAAPQLLDAAACRLIEPGLNPETALHAGVYSKDDEVGNCREFTHLLRKEAARSGVRFRFHTQVERIVAGPRPSLVVVRTPVDPRDQPPSPIARSASASDWPVTQPGDERRRGGQLRRHRRLRRARLARAAAAARPAACRCRRCSAIRSRAPLRHDDQHLHREPRAALMDERYKVAISRLGNRVRVAGCAEVGGRADRSDAAAQATLDKVLDDWFPGATRRGQAQRWKGARPMLPDGPPVLGASGVEGVWLNLGHGGSGWALACGSARLVADAVIGRPATMAIDGLGIERLRA